MKMSWGNKLNSMVDQNDYASLHLWCPYMRFCPNLNDNLMTQFNEGKGYQGIRALKTLELGNTRSDIKCCNHTDIKEKQYARQICTNKWGGHLPIKVTTDIVFTDEPVFQGDVLVAKNTFRWFQINEKW